MSLHISETLVVMKANLLDQPSAASGQHVCAVGDFTACGVLSGLSLLNNVLCSCFGLAIVLRHDIKIISTFIC